MSIIPERLAAGKIVRTMHFTAVASPKLVEIAGLSGRLHGIWIDQEHAGFHQSDLELMLIACRASGIDAFARVPYNDYSTVMRPMEAGCCGVMVAQVRTLDEVKTAAAWAKYPPEGIRGVLGGNIEARYGTTELATHIAAANRDRWLAIQIETAEAAEIIDQIAAVKGVDHLFVGPADLSVSLGVPGQFLHPKCVAVLERTGTAAKKHGKTWGTLSRNVEHARKCRSLGCQLFSIYGDLDCYTTGLRAISDKFSDFVGD